MQAANRSATRRRFSTSRSASTPPVDDNSPPSNLATTDLPDTGDRPSSGSIGSFMAGVASRKPAVLIMGCGKAVARFGLDGEESGGLAQPGGRGGGLAKARVPRSSVQEGNTR